MQPDPRRGDTPGQQTEGDAEPISGQRIDIQSSRPITYPARDATVHSGTVLDCVMAACVGRPGCPWAPWTCRLIGGTE